MKKKYFPCWCGVLLLLGSFPISSWCIEASLDTSATSAAVTSLAAKLSHADSVPLSTSEASTNSSTRQVLSKSTKLPEASASVTLQQEQSSTPSSASQAEPTEPAVERVPKKGVSETTESDHVEELHSSFDEAGTGEPEPVSEVDSSGSDSSTHQEAAPVKPQNPVDSPSTTAEFVSSEPSISDPLHSVSIIPLPLTPVPSDNQNDSLPSDLDPNNETENVKENTRIPRAAGSKRGVSDATLPPDLVPKDSQLPTSIPNIEKKTVSDTTPTSPDVPKPITPTPDGTQKPAVEAVQKPPTAVTEPIKVLTETLPGSVSNASEETDTGEEIPSFNEWAQKKLADAEKIKVQNASDPPKAPPKISSNLKVRSKNYASPDCGAKVLAANSEAQSVSSVLSPSRDEYALNPCTSSKIWFVVELCEAIQAKQLELANFELFSSSPKDFSVWVSDRFPTRDWHQLGQFTAQDERDIQTFPLQSNIFGKYVKVEQHSHWGSEHFCPVSLLRVYGISEFEVLNDDEHGARSPEDDIDGDDDITTTPGGDAANNIFGSARDVVINLVKKAAQVIGKSGHPKNTTEAEVSAETNVSCGITPSPGQKCSDCSPPVQSLLMCQPDTLKTLLASRFVLHSLHQNQLCSTSGAHNESYLATMLPTEYISALCHLLMVFHKPPESSTTAPTYDNLTLGDQARDPFLLLQPSETTTCSGPQVSSSTASNPDDSHPPAQASVPPSSSQVSVSDVASQIRPTGTLKDHEMSEVSSVPAPVLATVIPELPPPQAPDAGSIVPAENTTVIASTETPVLTEENSADVEQVVTTEEWTGGEPLDTLLADLKEENTDIDQTTPTTPTPTHTTEVDMEAIVPPPPPAAQPTLTPSTTSQQGGQQKESVFVRLANRIKVLERNMSLSAQYLEELSRRYKKQVEEMQKAFEKTLAAVGEAARQASQREQVHAEQLSSLEQRFTALAATTAALLAERESWQNRLAVLSQPFILLAVLVSCLVCLIRQCGSSSSPYRELTPEPLIIPPRRRSLEEIGVPSRHRKRRPSEEAAVCEQRLLARVDARSDYGIGDPSRKKRRKLRQHLRGVSVEELCSGLSPATLAAVRQPIFRAKHRLPTNPKSRRFSTESAPFLKYPWVAPVISTEIASEEVPNVNGDFSEVQVIQPTVEVITSEPVAPPSPSPSLQQKKQSGLRKMVRKLF